eukprot:5767458-Lingulodinium_polyedra.AAC.1
MHPRRRLWLPLLPRSHQAGAPPSCSEAAPAAQHVAHRRRQDEPSHEGGPVAGPWRPSPGHLRALRRVCQVRGEQPLAGLCAPRALLRGGREVHHAPAGRPPDEEVPAHRVQEVHGRHHLLKHHAPARPARCPYPTKRGSCCSAAYAAL